MTTVNIDRFATFRADAEPRPEPEIGTMRIPADGDCLAFDQSLGATGWVWLRAIEGRITVLSKGVIKAHASLNLRSNTDALTAAEELFRECDALFRRLGVPNIQVAHEAPPNAGKVPGSGVSSMAAATALRCAAIKHGLNVTIVARPTWAKFVCGNGRAEKKEVHAALGRWNIAGEPVTNEAQRDALCVGITALGR